MTLNASHPEFRHELLRSLPANVLDVLRSHLVRVTIVTSQTLHEIGVPIDDIYFIEEGLVLLTADAKGDGQAAVGAIGRDGVVGLSALLVPGTLAYHRAIVQAPGFAVRMRATALREMADQHPALRDRCLRYQQPMMNEAAQLAACNGLHELSMRLAHWLLLISDRLASDELPIIQQFMAFMLCVRRASVSMASKALGDRGLIRSMRGRIVALDRAGLEAAACPCYQIMKECRRQIMDASPNPSHDKHVIEGS